VKRVFAPVAVALGLLASTPVASVASPLAPAAPVAPAPTDSGRSPAAPDPRPPLAGRAPNGAVAGGDALLSRGLILPHGAPKLPPDIQAHAWVLADLDTGEILAARDPHGRYQPASIFKLLTSITIMPNLPGSRQVTISRAAAHAEGSSVGLLDGATYTVNDLFSELFLVSGNDAAMALAEANGGASVTVEQMNRKAEAIGAYDTFAQTPSGLDGWNQLTSAYDMTLILQQAVHNTRLRHYDDQPNYQFPLKKNGHGGVIPAFTFDNQSQQFLTTVPGALLAKTGFTDAAQHTYVAAVHEYGRTLGVVFLRNQRWPLDQWQQAVELFTWAHHLKPGTAPVGHLAGPISPEDPVAGTSLAPQPQQSPPPLTGVAAPMLSIAPNGQFVNPSAAAQKPHRGRTPLPWFAAGAVLVAAAGFGFSRLRPRRFRTSARSSQGPAPDPVLPPLPTQRSTAGSGPADT